MSVSGIEAITSVARVRAGLWLPYAILLVCVEFHAGVGLYRLAIKWGAGTLLTRNTLRVLEHLLLWFFLGLWCRCTAGSRRRAAATT